jgi:hypothetical protein
LRLQARVTLNHVTLTRREIWTGLARPPCRRSQKLASKMTGCNLAGIKSAFDCGSDSAAAIGPLAGLAEVQEPGCSGREARGGRGLGPMRHPRGDADASAQSLARLGRRRDDGWTDARSRSGAGADGVGSARSVLLPTVPWKGWSSAPSARARRRPSPSSARARASSASRRQGLRPAAIHLPFEPSAMTSMGPLVNQLIWPGAVNAAVPVKVKF